MYPRTLSTLTAVGLSIGLHLAIIGGALYNLGVPATSKKSPMVLEVRIAGKKPAAARTANFKPARVGKKANQEMDASLRWHDNAVTHDNAGTHDNGAEINYQPPEGLYHPKPRYPEAASQAFEEGSTLLLVDVSEDGTVSQVVVAKSSKNRTLDLAAVEGVKSWTFRPAMLDGKPVTARVEVPVDFHLE